MTIPTNRTLGPALAAALLLSTLGAAPAVAGTDTWTVDGAHSTVGFAIRHFFSNTTGRFGAFEGTVTVDPAKPTGAKIEATIETASVDTDNEKRDEHLRNADFFDVTKHPTMTFTSTKVTAAGGDKYTMVGDLTLLGVTKPVTLDVSFLGQGPDAWGGTRSGFTAVGTIDRREWGMGYNTLLDTGGAVLGNDVEIRLELELIKKK